MIEHPKNLGHTPSNKFPHSKPLESRQPGSLAQYPDTNAKYNLPTGIITFLFTDIEGSTQRWEQNPEAMQLALARHDDILLQAFKMHKGSAYKRIGDAFQVAFPSAIDALEASLAAQRALHSEPWDGTSLKVRMALHTGPAEPRDGDYVNPLLNRLARTLSAGHGGQTLLSAATYELLKDHLPPSIELRDMGERRLKDILRPEHIYQVLAPDLPAEFPPLKTLDAFHTNLPAPLTSFVGRGAEIAEIKNLIAKNRLITLIGVGGTGKTRLSLEVAFDLLDSFLDGIWFVEFASLTDSALVPQVTSVALDLYEGTDTPPIERLKGYLREKKALLILDNCEHLLDALAQMSFTLLQTCPNLSILATSRELLDVPGEISYQVPSLTSPETNSTQSVETIMQFEAAQLFVERAQTALLAFTLASEDAAPLTQICSHLDGIPLAIELAAARVKMFTIPQIAERLDDRFRLLTGGSRVILPRQQTLRAMIDWSYDLLSQPEQALLRRLSVFAGGWTNEAAERVCQGDIIEAHDVTDFLTHLVNKSLAITNAGNGKETRYHMLETIRQYAHEKLSETDKTLQIRDQHLQYFIDLAERAEPELIGPNIVEWLQRLELELDNLRAALGWSSKQNVQAGLQLASALLEFWQQGGYGNDGCSWIIQLLDQPEAQSDTLVRAKTLGVLGSLLLRGGNWNPQIEKAHHILGESIRLSEEFQEKKGVAFGLLLLGLLSSVYYKDHKQAQQQVLKSLEIYRELDDKMGTASALITLGGCLRNEGNHDMRTDYLTRGLEIFRELQYLPGIVHVLMHLGHLAEEQKDNHLAKQWLEEALELQHRLGKGIYTDRILSTLASLALQDENYVEAQTLITESISILGPTSDHRWPWVHLGYIHLRQGNIAQAESLFRENLLLFKKFGDENGVIFTIEGLASLAVIREENELATQLFVWASTARGKGDAPRTKFEQTNVERDIATLRAQLDKTTFVAAQTKGQAMSMDEAIVYALQSI